MDSDERDYVNDKIDEMVDAIHYKKMNKFSPYIKEYYTTYMDAAKNLQARTFIK